MSFDTDTLTDILSTFQERIATYYADKPLPARLTAAKPRGENDIKIEAGRAPKIKPSNHQSLQRTVFFEGVKEDCRALEAFLRHSFPALDNDYLSFGLDRFPGKGTGPRLKLFIRGYGRSDPASTVPVVAKRIEALHDRIGHLPRARQTYLVEDLRVPAANPRDALRIYVALRHPDLFKAQGGDAPAFTVSEICQVSLEEALA